MTPTPTPSSVFQPQSHFRVRRLRHPVAFVPSHPLTPALRVPVTPLQDDGEHGDAQTQLGDDIAGLDGDEELEREDVDGDGDEGSIGSEGVGEDVEEDGNEEGEDDEAGIEEVPMDLDVPFDANALGLKEIGNLASWTVSSCKPGCGVEALRDDDTGLFWQSDGPQPHHLNIHFSRLVSILAIRIFLDFEADESYTPTRITLLAGTGYHDLIPFSSLEFAQPKGWIDVPLDDVGGGEDGKTLRAFLVQVRVVENHQNGKDTHVRGLKIFAKDERLRGGMRELDVMEVLNTEKQNRKGKDRQVKVIRDVDSEWIAEPDWMDEPELR